MRSRICWQAAFTAAPLRSVPLDAAVALVFGTLSVAVRITRMAERGTPNSAAQTFNILVWSPCPISVPPWFNWTEPSA